MNWSEKLFIGSLVAMALFCLYVVYLTWFMGAAE